MREPFVPPPYPYDRLDELKEIAAGRPGGLVDLSIGTPCDPPPAAVLEALARSGSERGYPPSIGTASYREAAAAWMARRLGVTIDADHVAACVGTKELVAGIPQWLRLRQPDRDTVLYPAISYPTYAMGATLAGCRAVPVRGPRGHRPGRRGARALPLGERARQPDRRAPRPRGGRGVGPGPRRAGPGGRVLHRVHLGRAAAHDPRARRGRGAGGALAVEAVEPRRRAGRLLRRGSGAGPLPVRGAQARRLHGARSGPGRGGGRLGRRRARRAAAGPVSQRGWR